MSLDPQTMLIHGFFDRSQYEEMSEPIYLTSGYTYSCAEEAEKAFKGDLDRFVYSRFGNPTTRILEKRLASLEGAESCVTTASGMAAVFASLACFLEKGSRIVSSRALFGSCDYIISKQLPKFGVESVMIDGTQIKNWERELSDKTDAVFLESPSNPTLEIVDIRKVCDLAHRVGANVVVDNVFANPMVQQPMKLGADVVVYSTTKHMDGQGRTIGGAILCNEEFMKNHLLAFVRNTGPCLSPFVSWVILKGMETLPIRNKTMCENALALAQYLESHPKIELVLFPGLDSHPQRALVKEQMLSGGNLLAFKIKGKKLDAFALMNALSLVKISNNHGDSKSIITHPATTTHQRFTEEERTAIGIDDNLLRVSCGLENTQDLLNDFDNALRLS